MEFYHALSRVLKLANELDKYENIQEVSHYEKEKTRNNFIEKLIYFLNIQVKNKESNNFRIYFIEYLSQLITSSLTYCSYNQKSEIKYLVKEIIHNTNALEKINVCKDNLKNLKDEDDNKANREHINNKPNIFNNKNNLKENEKNDLSLNVKEKAFNQKCYFPQNVSRIDLLQKRNNIPNNITSDNPKNFYSNKINQNVCNLNDFINKNDFILQNKKNNANIYLNEENIFNKNIKQEIVENKHKKYNDYNNEEYIVNNIKKNNSDNNESIKNNSNKIDININNNFEKNGGKEPIIKEHHNKKINTYFSKEDNFKDNIINNNDLVLAYNLNRLEESKKRNQFNSKTNITNKAYKFQKEIDFFYQELFKDNISRYFINSIIYKRNNINRICSSIFNLIENNKMEYIEQIYKEKLTTLVCILFIFAKGLRTRMNNYIFRADSEIDKKLIKYLRQNILIQNNPKDMDFTQNKINVFTKDFCKNLFLENKVEGKYIIFTAYTFLVILRLLRNYSRGNEKQFFDELLEKEYIISFKLNFILKHQEFYNAISTDFIEIYHGLHFINVFYSEIFYQNNENNRIRKDDKINKYVFGKNRFVLSFEKNCDFNIDILFSKIDNEIYKEVMEKIGHFYNINQFEYNDINDLIYYSTNNSINKEDNFIFNLVEHVCNKKRYIYNNFNDYINNLKSLEYEIFYYGKNILNKSKRTRIENYSINETQRNVFFSLLNKINKKINPRYLDKFELFPYGSITQFLGGNNSDIDIYLHINDKMKDNREKIYFLNALEKTIANIIKEPPKTVISRRLCLISFKYSFKEGKKVDFDISLMGFCPYIHSTLLRAYSLMEPRFSLLAITLKRFISIIKIKNYENRQYFLNSFSWMILLITFLQDIIKPQILPKILSNGNNFISNTVIPYGNYNEKYMIKNFSSFVQNIKDENTRIPECLFNNKLLKKIYQEKILKHGKNNLSCAELFLYFLEFVIYYFKSDSVYINCSVENEAYESMSCIMNNHNKNIFDERFQEYFKYKYFKSVNYDNNNKKTRDGIFLIRDPFDPHYNPAQTLRNKYYKIFIENLQKGYSSLLKNGNKIFHLEKLNNY